MPTYRVELAKTGRAGCQNTECKKNGVKIQKDELRFGNLVEIKENQSWHWKHWGCVTPFQIENWAEISNNEPDMIDGLDELPQDMRDKVLRALNQGHVDDEDWNGDREMNRDGNKKFRVFTPKKKTSKDMDEDGSGSPIKAKPSKAPAKKGSSKKRAREEDDDDDEDEVPSSPPKKAKKSQTKAKKADVSVTKTAKPAKKTKKASKVQESDDESEVEAKPKRVSKKKDDVAPTTNKPPPKDKTKKKAKK